jgi:signal transduction histidine kinase
VQDDKAVMASGKRSEVEEPVADSINGMRYIETIKTPIFNEHGHVTGTVGIAHDITDRRLNEAALKKANNDLRRNERALQNMLFDLKKAQDHVKQAHRQLLQSEKLASIGQLAAGVAHEINNPISFISSNLSTLQKYIGILAALHTQCDAINTALKADDIPLAHTLLKDIQEMKEREDIPFLLHDTQNLIRESQDGIERIKKIVIDLRTFSRKDEETMSPANLNTILDGILSIVWNEIKYKAEVRKEYGVIGNVRCNQQQIGQVFINILVNAAQAIKENGIIQLHTYEENERIIVEITDNGSGIPEEIIDRVFDPFFTTKEVGKGTGLGLSISYDIIKKHNGSIDVESESGMGTTFRIALPRTDK